MNHSEAYLNIQYVKKKLMSLHIGLSLRYDQGENMLKCLMWTVLNRKVFFHIFCKHCSFIHYEKKKMSCCNTCIA